MTHEITPDSHYTDGETVVWEFSIEEDDAAKDLTGATVRYYLLPTAGADSADAIADDSGSDITLDTSGLASGEISVTLAPGAAAGYGGERLWHRLVVTDSADNTQIWRGSFPVQVA